MRRFSLPMLAIVAFTGVGCNTPESVLEVSKHNQPVVDIRNVILNGQARVTFPFAVPGDVGHPHFEGRWTLRDKEKPVQVFVFRAQDYDDSLPPRAAGSCSPPDTTGCAIWSWTSTSDKPEMHVHPTPGNWVVVFFNPALPGPTTRADVSSEIDFSYFK